MKSKLAFAMMLVLASLSLAQAGESYPTKPIRMLAPAIGGASDIAGRLLAQALSMNMGEQVVVDNRGSIAPEIAARAAPDGYTILSYGSPLWLIPFIRNNVPWDPVRDFIPISLTASSPNVLVVNPSLPVHSVKELIALVKSEPGKLNFGSGSTGALTHLTGEMFNLMAGVRIVRVAYRGNGPALTALMGGQVQLMFANAGSVVPLLNSGRLRPLAVTSAKPSKLVPGLPTVAATGVPGFQSLTIIGIFVPARTPSVIVQRLNTEIVRVLHNPEVEEKFLKIGVEPVGNSLAEFAADLKTDMAKWSKVIKDAGIHE